MREMTNGRIRITRLQRAAAANATVQKAIDTTKKVLGKYFENTCRQRLAGGAGSIYEGINTPEEMEAALRAAIWLETDHPTVMKGCRAFMTRSIPGGRFGLVRIANLPEDAVLTASDPKGTGMVSMTIKGHKGPAVAETWLIIGEENGYDVVFTFHPGKPVKPSMVEVKNCPDGTKLTKAEAMGLGFDLAKVV